MREKIQKLIVQLKLVRWAFFNEKAPYAQENSYRMKFAEKREISDANFQHEPHLEESCVFFMYDRNERMQDV